MSAGQSCIGYNQQSFEKIRLPTPRHTRPPNERSIPFWAIQQTANELVLSFEASREVNQSVVELNSDKS